jgi:biopolymer transport protein ExbD
MSSMTDIVFLLLIFFMLTSSVVTTSALPVSLPKSDVTPIQFQQITISVTEEMKYAIDGKIMSFDQLKPALEKKIAESEEKIDMVVVHADENIQLKEAVKVVNIPASLGLKVNFATRAN